MESIPRLIEEIERERIQRARAASPEEKLLDGPRLFDRVCLAMKDGIRMQHPDADEEEVQRILRKRPAVADSLEKHPWTATMP